MQKIITVNTVLERVRQMACLRVTHRQTDKGEIKEDMAKKTSKKQLEQYEHSDRERASNLHVGLLASSSEPLRDINL